MAWFAKVVKKLSSKKETIQTLQDLKDFIRSTLKKTRDYDLEPMIDSFIAYLSELNLVAPSRPKTASSQVQLLFLLEDAKPEKLVSNWGLVNYTVPTES